MTFERGGKEYPDSRAGRRVLERVTQGDISRIKEGVQTILEGRDLSGLDLSQETADKGLLVNLNLNESDLTGANVDGAFFNHSILTHTTMPRIRIGTETVELLDNELTLPNDQPWTNDATLVPSKGSCSDAERLNRIILGTATENDFARMLGVYDITAKNAKMYGRRGVLVASGSDLIGYLKLKGERTFVAARTVRHPSGGVVFWKGMVYALDPVLEEWLLDASDIYKRGHPQTWRKVDISLIAKELGANKFGSNNMRFVRDPGIFKSLDVLCANVKNDLEPSVQIRTGSSLRIIIRRIIRRMMDEHAEQAPVRT